MATVYVPFQCRRFTGGKGVVAAGGATIEELFSDLEKSFPGIMTTIRGDGGEVKRHISIFANNEDIRHLENLATRVGENDEISIVSAIAGG